MPTALITGASRGLGAEIARQLAPTHDLLLGGRPSPELDRLATELDGASTFAVELTDYVHRESAVYLLGAEDHGLTNEALAACHDLVTIPCPSPFSMNVAVAGSLVIYDRFMQASHATAMPA